jgi:hypothetical protein
VEWCADKRRTVKEDEELNRGRRCALKWVFPNPTVPLEYITREET